MIRNYALFYIAMATAGVAVIRRHGATLDRWFFEPGTVAGMLPEMNTLFGVTVLLVILSLIPFNSLTAPKRLRVRSRREFKPESYPLIRRRIQDMAQDETPDVPLIIDYIIYQAIEVGASDIHLDPDRNGFSVLFRVDGMMNRVAEVPSLLRGAITNRLKVLSNLVVYQGFLPQDGRLASTQKSEDRTSTPPEAKGAEFRIAFMPTLHGERVVIRILGRSEGVRTFHDLGMSEIEERMMRRFIGQPQGMIILTGPTGSGKTTTIYAALRAIQQGSGNERSIATLEDPIEYEIPGINQSQVDEKKNYTFDRGLRAMLRQDPDVIMVGEIRDAETAKIAIQAGMTGHLIITTVHANSSTATFSRLLEMGAAAFSLNTAVTAVIAQRLVRRLCPTCRRERQITDQEREQLGLQGILPVFDAEGCSDCGGSGFKGRVALYEILEVTEPIRTLVSEGASSDAIYVKAKEQGMLTLFEAGIDALKAGATSPAEVLRVVMDSSR